MKRLLSGTGFVLLTFCGCDETVYELYLRPHGAECERELVCWRQDPADRAQPLRLLSAEELARIAAVYGQPAPEPARRKFSFAGMFTETMPPDIGGAGWYIHADTELGTFWYYSERFRGEDDFAGRVAGQLGAADRLVELIQGWLETQLAGSDGWEGLDAFLAGEFRSDLHNLVLYWVAHRLMSASAPDPEESPVHGDGSLPGIAFRTIHYAAEHGYVPPGEIGATAGQLAFLGSGRSGPDDERALASVLHVMILRKAALPRDAAIRGALREMLAAEAPFSALRAHLKTVPEWESINAAWLKEREHNPALAEPDAMRILGSQVQEMFGSGVPDTSARLRVRLYCPVEPFESNGTWQPEASAVVWSTPIHGADRLPTLCFALWTVPDTAAQTRGFGRVILDGEGLMRYSFWEQGLVPAHRAEWRAFVGTLRPGQNARERLRAFLFNDEREADGPPADERLAQSRAARGRALLLEALDRTARDEAPGG